MFSFSNYPRKWAERRLIKASGLFDETYYRAQCPAACVGVADPIWDYLTSGVFAGRDPNPLFDTDWYLAANSDVRAAGENPLVHYLTSGADEGRAPCSRFDTELYVSQLSMLERSSYRTPLQHYFAIGKQRGLRYSAFYDPALARHTGLDFHNALSPKNPAVLMV